MLFTVDNLKTLVKNGRLSKIQGMIGNILKIKPILSFKQGVLEVAKKVRSKLGAIDYITSFVEDNCSSDLKTEVRIEYIDEDEGALTLKERIEKLGRNIKVTITGVISPVISAHVGLGALGVYLVNY